jgi:hypothetical protein
MSNGGSPDRNSLHTVGRNVVLRVRRVGKGKQSVSADEHSSAGHEESEQPSEVSEFLPNSLLLILGQTNSSLSAGGAFQPIREMQRTLSAHADVDLQVSITDDEAAPTHKSLKLFPLRQYATDIRCEGQPESVEPAQVTGVQWTRSERARMKRSPSGCASSTETGAPASKPLEVEAERSLEHTVDAIGATRSWNWQEQRFYRLRNPRLLLDLVGQPLFVDIQLPPSGASYGQVRRRVQFADDDYDYYVSCDLLSSVQTDSADLDHSDASDSEIVIMVDEPVSTANAGQSASYGHSHEQSSVETQTHRSASVAPWSLLRSRIRRASSECGETVVTQDADADECETSTQTSEGSNTDWWEDFEYRGEPYQADDLQPVNGISRDAAYAPGQGLATSTSTSPSIIAAAVTHSLRAWAAYGSDCHDSEEHSPCSSPAWSPDIDN